MCKTQRQPKDTPGTNWEYGDLYTNDAVANIISEHRSICKKIL